jgi:hypothetical protein
LAPKITFQILKDKNIRATKRMSEVAKNLQDTSILAMVGRLIMKSDCYMAPMLALYMDSSDALLKHSTDLQNAWSFAKGIPQEAMASQTTHDELAKYLAAFGSPRHRASATHCNAAAAGDTRY